MILRKFPEMVSACLQVSVGGQRQRRVAHAARRDTQQGPRGPRALQTGARRTAAAVDAAVNDP